MAYNKWKMLLAAVCAFCATGAKADNVEGLTFLLQSGQTVSFAFTECPKVIVSDEGLRVETDGEERVSYAFDDVKRVYFDNLTPTSIPGVGAEKVQKAASCLQFSCHGGTLTAAGLVPGEVVTVFDLSGRLAAKATAGADGTLSVAVGTFQQGTYVVKAGSGASFKIIKR